MLFDIPLKKEMLSVAEQFSHYISTLPSELRDLTKASSLWKERGAGLSHFLPFWLNQEFSGGDFLPEARQMALANRFGQIFCLIQDGVIDKHAGTKPEILILLNALFFRFLYGYQKLFPASHTFWTYFEKYWQEYLQALAWEKAHHHERIAPYTHEDFLWLGRKFSPVKICCAGMALLSGREEEIPCLSNSIEHLHVGYQLLDDVEDWPEDIENRDYTYLLTLVHLKDQQGNQEVPLPPEEIEKRFWSGGLAGELFQKAIDLLTLSLQDISHLSLPAFKKRIKKLQRETRQKQEKITKHMNNTGEQPQLQIFSQDGHHIVFNVSTSSLYEVDRESVSLLKRMPGKTWQAESTEDDELMQELREAGLFAALPPPEIEDGPPLKTLALNISSQCNLFCSYCFAEQGKYKGENKSMSSEVGERAIDLLLRESGHSPNVKIIFFGGEPMLNSQLITHLIEYGRQQSAEHGKKMRFSLITNGTLMPSRMIDLFRKEEVTVVVSLDGPPEVQNRLRPTVQGEKTYNRVVQNIRELQKGGVQEVSIQATLGSHTLSPMEILEHLLSLDASAVSIQYMQPTSDCKYTWWESDPSAMMKYREELADHFFYNLLQGRIIPYAGLLKPLTRLYRRDRFVYNCAAGVTMGSVNAEGSVFPCYRFFEEPSAALGNVFTGLDRKKFHPYIQNSVDRQDTCKSCWVRYLCGGNCRYSNLLLHGEISRPHSNRCTQIKHHFQVVLHLFARIMRKLPELPELKKRIEKAEEIVYFPPVGGV